jgi:hypothetical protein
MKTTFFALMAASFAFAPCALMAQTLVSAPAATTLINKAPQPAFAVSTRNTNLGVQDGAVPVQGELTIINVGTQTQRIINRNGDNVTRLKFFYPKALTIAPHESLTIPWQYDLHGAEPGNITLKTELETDDPAALKISETWQITYQPKTMVSPYRSTALATDNGDKTLLGDAPVRFRFKPLQPGEKFVEVNFKDADIPLKISGIQQTDDGMLIGSVSIDTEAIIKGAPRHGESQIIAKTASGDQNYFFIQWAVLDKKR